MGTSSHIGKKVSYLIGLAVVISMSLSSVCHAQPAKPSPSPYKPPVSMLTVANYDVGSTAYVTFAIISQSILEKYGVRIRNVPFGSDVARQIPVRTGDMDVLITASSSVWSREGLMEYSTSEWGPQPIQAIWLCRHGGVALSAAGDSNIYKTSDFKGKKVAWFVGSMGMNSSTAAGLADAGLTFDDVQIVRYPSTSAAWRAYVQGDVDQCTGTPTSSVYYEVQAARGIRWLPMSRPSEDPEAWKRVHKYMPMWIGDHKVTQGPGLSETKWVWGATYAYPAIMCYPNLDEEKVYFLAKAINECYPMYKDKHSLFPGTFALDSFLWIFSRGTIPVHKGTIRYLREIGKWTPELEAINNKNLDRDKQLKLSWNATLDEVSQKGLKQSEFQNFWRKARAEKLGEMGMDPEDMKRWESGKK